MSTPNSAELQDLLSRVVETIDAERGAGIARDNALRIYRHDSDELAAAKLEAWRASRVVGTALHDMRAAIRSAATVLDHAHACDTPTSAELVREAARLREQVARLTDQVETLGGNAERVFVYHAASDGHTLLAACGRQMGLGDGHISLWAKTVLRKAEYDPENVCSGCVAAVTPNTLRAV